MTPTLFQEKEYEGKLENLAHSKGGDSGQIVQNEPSRLNA
jgi:hypothetical protein